MVCEQGRREIVLEAVKRIERVSHHPFVAFGPPNPLCRGEGGPEPGVAGEQLGREVVGDGMSVLGEEIGILSRCVVHHQHSLCASKRSLGSCLS